MPELIVFLRGMKRGSFDRRLGRPDSQPLGSHVGGRIGGVDLLVEFAHTLLQVGSSAVLAGQALKEFGIRKPVGLEKRAFPESKTIRHQLIGVR